MKLAAIDIGSNSIKLIVVEAAAGDSFAVLAREKEVVRLGHDTLRQGFLSAEAVGRAAETLNRFRSIAEARGAERVLAIATASVREASNAAGFIAGAERGAGLRVEVLSGGFHRTNRFVDPVGAEHRIQARGGTQRANRLRTLPLLLVDARQHVMRAARRGELLDRVAQRPFSRREIVTLHERPRESDARPFVAWIQRDGSFELCDGADVVPVCGVREAE